MENKSLAQSMRKESNASLSSAKSRLTESKLRAAEVQRKEGIENEHLVSETRVKDEEEITVHRPGPEDGPRRPVQSREERHDVRQALPESQQLAVRASEEAEAEDAKEE